MTSAATIGQLVRLKPARAKAYGFDPAEVYRVESVFTHNGYKAVWAELSGGQMIAPCNRVRISELH